MIDIARKYVELRDIKSIKKVKRQLSFHFVQYNYIVYNLLMLQVDIILFKSISVVNDVWQIFLYEVLSK